MKCAFLFQEKVRLRQESVQERGAEKINERKGGGRRIQSNVIQTFIHPIDLQGHVKFGRVVHQKEPQLKEKIIPC